MEEIKLGERVRSRASRFTGTLTGICHYLYSEPKYQVTADIPVNGKTQTEWFSFRELERVD